MNPTQEIYNELSDFELFCRSASNLTLRQYQVAPAHTIIRSVFEKKGLSIVVMFPRQSGKNELQAQIEVYLLTLYSLIGGEMIKVSPTWKPQSLNAMRRLERVLSGNNLSRLTWRKEEGYIYRNGKTRVYFFSGQPEANIVGATASLLLEVDEAQDVEIAKFDKDIAPMAASTNATRVFWGTAWTSRTLLARELRAAQEAEKRDGIRRVFRLDASAVGEEVPAYAAFVQEQVAKLGRTNPMIRTQYFSEEIDAEGGLFTPDRLALMHGDHPCQTVPSPDRLYAILIDVAGVDESNTSSLGEGAGSGFAMTGSLANPGRDSTALTIVEADLASLADPLIAAPTYRVVQRRVWTGISHAKLYTHIRAICDLWRARCIVIDATGVGAGLASFLSNTFGERVIPFTFTSASKSQLGWDFLAIVDSGRWKEASQPEGEQAELQSLYYTQLTFTQYEILPGPARLMRWQVPDGTRNPATGELVHDDLVMSAALAAALEDEPWTVTGVPRVIRAADPMAEMDRGF